MIPVTKPFLPPKKEYDALLAEIWDRNWLTNNGPFVQQLESEVSSFLGLDDMVYVSNGTIAIQIALKALNITKEVITTPFSYVATTSSLVWEGCTPIYVDIDKNTFNIDSSKIEAAITPNTQAILATHVFGNPCDIEAIQDIAERHNLKVIYDASHCFGVKYKGKSVFEYGDISTVSFHATKLFHTIEGGGSFTKDREMLSRIRYMRNFGHNGPEKFNGVGINAKNSEFHAALGVVNLKYIELVLKKRKEQFEMYDDLCINCNVLKQQITPETAYNYAYYPVIFKDIETTLEVKKALEENDIFPRRYFYPSLSKLEYVNDSLMPTTENISSRILILPLYHELKMVEQKLVVQILKGAQINSKF